MDDKLEPCQLDAKGRPLPVVNCPVCGHIFDSATLAGKGDQRPGPGDYSMCIECGEVLRFDDNMVERRADLNDMLELQKDPQLLREFDIAQKLLREHRMKWKP